MSVFAKYEARSFPYRFGATLHVSCIAGGTPSDSNVAEGWLRSKLAPKDDLIREMVAEVMAERGVDAEEAAKIVDLRKHLNGFKRFRPEDDQTGLYIEGRQVKAAIKEAGSVAVAAGKLEGRGWGKTNKGLLGYLSEHVFVVEDRIPLGVAEPSGIAQRFITSFRGTGIQYEEYVDDAKVSFTVMTDHNFSEQEWAHIWLTGQQQGLGASRSQGFGRYEVVRWEPLT
jgi:hypothetical protein